MSRSIAEALANVAASGADTELIPHGLVCYTPTGENGMLVGELPYFGIMTCPYWARDPERPQQESGYCAFTRTGDWEEGWGILWDQVKSCGLNADHEDADHPRAKAALKAEAR